MKLHIIRALALPVGTLLGALGTLAVYTPASAPAADVMDTRPDIAASPTALLEAHDCWTGEAPADMAGVIPGHVVTQNGYQGAAAVGRAFEQIFDGADHGLTVYGFCR